MNFPNSKVTRESTIKPELVGDGMLMLYPTYKHILLINAGEWDGLVQACQSSVKQKVVARATLSSAALGGEGPFHPCLTGRCTVAIESPVPASELIEFVLKDDELRIN